MPAAAPAVSAGTAHAGSKFSRDLGRHPVTAWSQLCIPQPATQPCLVLMHQHNGAQRE
jgi:hypothetical protein